MKGNDRKWDGYLSKTASRRSFSGVYHTKKTLRESIQDFFVISSRFIESPFSFLKFKRRTAIHTPTYERINLSGISSDETFIIMGRRPSKLSRMWKKFKEVFKDDSPRVPYNSKHQFAIRGSPQSPKAYSRQRKLEMLETVDLSAVAKTLEKGKIR